MDNITPRVIEVVGATLQLESTQIAEEARFVEDLGAESVQSVELVAAFEEEFDIDMDEEAALQVKTVQDAVTFIRQHLKR
jgi:acyl carrier protein